MNDLYFYAKTEKETGRLASRAKFSEGFPCEHETSYLQSDGFACKMRSQERKSIAGRANVVIDFYQIPRAASHPILEHKCSSDGLNSSSHIKTKREDKSILNLDGKARFASYFCPQDCSQAAIVVRSKMRTRSSNTSVRVTG